MAAGDIICQYLTKDSSPSWKLDLKRMLIFASWGAIGFTPLAYQWYGGMENIVPATLPYRFLIKTALDQTIFSSGVTTITFSKDSLSTPLAPLCPLLDFANVFLGVLDRWLAIYTSVLTLWHRFF